MIVHGLDVFHRRGPCVIPGISWRDHANEEVMRRTGSVQTTIHCRYKEKENGCPHRPTAERKTRTYSNELGARRRQTKEREVEEDVTKVLSKKLGTDVCQLSSSPHDRQ